MLPKFFIDRPVFAIVVSIVITLVGLLSIFALPIAQYPEITPPTVQVQATYTGADAQTVVETVAAPIEEQVNGAQDMLYMNSISSNDGRMVLTVTFEVGRDLELATVDVQNRVNLAQPKLPQDVKNSGVSVKKQSPNMLCAINLNAPNGDYDVLFLNNYLAINIKDAIARISGVGDAMLFGDQDYGMRVWLDPDKMAKLGITATDVADAVREQNVQAPAGQIGAPPAPTGQVFQITVRVKGRLTDVGEFENIIVRANPDGSSVRIKDVGRVEMGSKSYYSFSRLDGSPTATLLIYQLPGANALDIIAAIRGTMEELSNYFPEGISYSIPYDTTLFVNASIEEVLHTLYEALFLVFVVVFIFLQNIRATIIPMIAVPVSLVGTFAAFTALGFSINTLTLFAMVLAIGIVVDDAIVVVEAVQLNIDEKGMSPVEATRAAMDEVSGAIVATTIVLIAVFVPVAFMGGITGRLYQQFALTLAVSVFISSINALTFSPAMSALLLRPYKKMRGPLGWFFDKFNAVFGRTTKGYETSVRGLIRRSILTLLVLVGILGAAGWLLKSVPTGFVPEEDQGYFIVNMQLPPGASLEMTDKVVRRAEEYLKTVPGVRNFLTLGGFNLLTQGYTSYAATLFVMLDPWDERQTPELSLAAIMGGAQKHFWAIQDAVIICFNPPAIQGLGTTGGFQFELQDRSGAASIRDLADTASAFMAKASQLPPVTNVFTPFSADVPQVFMEIDRQKVKKLAVPVNSVFETLQTFLGGLYVNDFNKYGRTYRVMLQADKQYRQHPDDTRNMYVRGSSGKMIPMSTISNITPVKGPEYVRRFNLYKAVEVSGATPAGYSSGQSIAAMEKLAAEELPQGYGYAWTNIAYQEKQSGSQAVYIFALALLMVFLVLAAQYESWSTPLAVVLAVPLGVFGAMAAQYLRGLNNDIYAQIGLVMLIGLAAKNAILIVEYAKGQHERGKSPAEASAIAANLRFRPILMTSFAFILGIVPLVTATGAGSASRWSLGTAVFGGMLAATILGVFFVPLLYYVVVSIAGRFSGRK